MEPMSERIRFGTRWLRPGEAHAVVIVVVID
jgi:hypothetical protein